MQKLKEKHTFTTHDLKEPDRIVSIAYRTGRIVKPSADPSWVACITRESQVRKANATASKAMQRIFRIKG